MDFWDRLKFQIEAQNTTQGWVAQKIGISRRTLEGWLSKRIFPSVDVATTLAQALGVTVEYLVTGHDSTDPWLREHRAFIEDCKLLSVETFQAMQSTIQALADSVRNKIKHA